MTWTLPADATFTVETPAVAAGGWSKPEAQQVSPWATKPAVRPSYQDDEGLKKAFGIELAKAANPFEAACKIFVDTSQALWASVNWLTDAIVIASRDIYLKTVELNAAPLDKNQLAAKVLKLAEGERVERNGVLIPTIEAKDRIAAYKLYSEIQGYTGKVEIDNSVTNNTLNEMTIKLVKADSKPVTIDHAPNVKSEILNENLPSPISLKLVKAG